MRTLLQLGWLILCALLSLVLTVVLLAWLLVAPAGAAPPSAFSSPILLVSALADAPPAARARGEVLRRAVALPPRARGCVARLAGDAAGSEPFWADDRLTLIARHADGSTDRLVFDFRDPAMQIRPRPAEDLPALAIDVDQVEVILEDLQPPTWGVGALWLLPCASAPVTQQEEEGAPAAPLGALPRSTTAAAIPADTPTATPTLATAVAVAPPSPVISIVGTAPAASSTAPAAALLAERLPIAAGTGRARAPWIVAALALLATALCPWPTRLARRYRTRPVVPTGWLLRLEVDDPFVQRDLSLAADDLPRGVALAPPRLVAPDDAAAIGQLERGDDGQLALRSLHATAGRIRVSADGVPVSPPGAGQFGKDPPIDAVIAIPTVAEGGAR